MNTTSAQNFSPDLHVSSQATTPLLLASSLSTLLPEKYSIAGSNSWPLYWHVRSWLTPSPLQVHTLGCAVQRESNAWSSLLKSTSQLRVERPLAAHHSVRSYSLLNCFYDQVACKCSRHTMLNDIENWGEHEQVELLDEMYKWCTFVCTVHLP